MRKDAHLLFCQSLLNHEAGRQITALAVVDDKYLDCWVSKRHRNCNLIAIHIMWSWIPLIISVGKSLLFPIEVNIFNI